MVRFKTRYVLLSMPTSVAVLCGSIRETQRINFLKGFPTTKTRLAVCCIIGVISDRFIHSFPFLLKNCVSGVRFTSCRVIVYGSFLPLALPHRCCSRKATAIARSGRCYRRRPRTFETTTMFRRKPTTRGVKRQCARPSRTWSWSISWPGPSARGSPRA